ncbi:uncharacterized protein LTR77_006872 [Saxophila tyrrhenica]|uniref:DUF7587 domain-containing protein n=1 Tax=Saxophila tyrrhenica TaxID=1690608 RepID=A0AAV9P6J0_9PEZI|nr:hypothetical protein LTR77_006872 [Saxophila tyrrhenica]
MDCPCALVTPEKHGKRALTPESDTAEGDEIIVSTPQKRRREVLVRELQEVSVLRVGPPRATRNAPNTAAPRTPLSKSAASRRSLKTSCSDFLADSPRDRAQEPYVAPPDSVVHLPLGDGLFFRFWSEYSHGYNSPTGFVAGKYTVCNITWAEPPSVASIDPAEFWNHINPAEDRTVWPSPFISVPAKAILHTFKLSDMATFVSNTPGMAEALRLNDLMMRGNFRSTVREVLGSARIQLDARLAAGLAKLCMFVGLSTKSSIGNLSNMVCDFVKGWNFVLENKDSDLWQEVADAFVHVFVVASERPVSFSDQLKVQHGFLDGVRWASGDFNAWYKPCLAIKMQGKATKIGLDDPAALVLANVEQEIRSTRSQTRAHRRAHDRILRGEPTRALEVEEVDPERVLLESGGDSDDDGSVYEL